MLGCWAGRRGLLDDPGRHRALLTRIGIVGIGVSLLGALPAALITIDVIRLDAVSAGGPARPAGSHGRPRRSRLRGGVRPAQPPAGRAARARHSAVAAVGQRSLTFYLFNSVLVAVVLHRDLLGVGERVDSFGALTVAVTVWLVAVLLAAWMDRTGRPGPVDALLRRLVYSDPVPGNRPARRRGR